MHLHSPFIHGWMINEGGGVGSFIGGGVITLANFNIRMANP